jgi:hypothetical protein
MPCARWCAQTNSTSDHQSSKSDEAAKSYRLVNKPINRQIKIKSIFLKGRLSDQGGAG